MNKKERIKKLLDAIVENNIVTTKEFINYAKSIDINYLSATRDLAYLKSRRLISIKFDRITVKSDANTNSLKHYSKVENIEEKTIISLTASDLLSNEETIFVGPGTTCEYFVHYINKPVKLLVTNSINVMLKATNNSFINETVLCGGKMNNSLSYLYGDDAIENLIRYRFTKAFITATNINTKGVLYSSLDELKFLIRQVLSQTQLKVALIDSTKFDINIGSREFVDTKELDLLITDDNIDEEKLKHIKESINIIIANKDKN